MIKKLLMLFVALGLAINTFAQTASYAFPQPGFEQVEVYHGDWTTGGQIFDVKYIYQHDSLINSFNYSVFEFIRSSPSEIYFYNDNGKIYVHEFNNTLNDPLSGRLIYDFSMNFGDSIFLTGYNTGGYFTVDSVGQASLPNGQARKYLRLSNSVKSIHWIDGVGDVEQGLLYLGDMGGGYGEFVCSKDSSGLVYVMPNTIFPCIYSPCYLPADTIFAEICFGDSILMNGNYYYFPGIYADTLANTSGCDSVKVLVLGALPPESSFSTISICQGDSSLIFDQWETTSGLYEQTFTSVSGCDSTSYVMLIVDPLPPVFITGDYLLCYGETGILTASGFGSTFMWSTGQTSASIAISEPGLYSVTSTNIMGCVSTASVYVVVFPSQNLKITQNGYKLTASYASKYQWYKDNMPIPGATQNECNVISDGSYKVKGTSLLNCEEFSPSVMVTGTSINKLSKNQKAFEIYPNPAKNGFHVRTDGDWEYLEVYDFSGKLLLKEKFMNTEEFINLKASPGQNWVLLRNRNGETVMKKLLVVE